MNSLIGIALGFLVAPSLAALICAFAYADRAFGTSRTDVQVGIALGVLTLFVVVGLAMKFGFPR